MPNRMKNYKAAFSYAFNGLRIFVRTERNAPIMLMASIVAIGLSAYFKLNATEWLFICLSICMVFGAELFNTSLEQLSDRLIPERDDAVKMVKDLAAAGSMFAVLFALISALLIFIPKL